MLCSMSGTWTEVPLDFEESAPANPKSFAAS